MTMLYDRFRALLCEATRLAAAAGDLSDVVEAADIPLEQPRHADHGDLATNLAMQLARRERNAPRRIADALAPHIEAADTDGLLERVEIAGPGFLNMRLSAQGWQAALLDVLRGAEAYGTWPRRRTRVLIEFVSANPTGPMHVGHGRGAVVGDVLARLMRAAGYEVTTEYYINNVGNQISKLGESAWSWMRALRDVSDAERDARVAGDKPTLPGGFPEDGYRGGYIAATALDLLRSHDDATERFGLDAPSWDDQAWWAAHEPASRQGRGDDRAVSIAAWQQQLARIRDDLALLDIHFDVWMSERVLHGLDAAEDGGQPTDLVQHCAARLLDADRAYHGDPPPIEDAARSSEAAASDARPLVFRGSAEDIPKSFRDTKDRVIIRSDGRPTYFAADIAYHDHKLQRGYDTLINVFGADHHGYVPRLKGIIHVLGALHRHEGRDASRWEGDPLEVLLMQMVSLLRDGEPVQMGKRSGDFVTLRDVIDEVTTAEEHSGRDAVRFLFLTRKAEAQLDFDLEVARRTSMDNPVYYVQMAHARLASILAKAAEDGAPPPADDLASLAALGLDDERQLAMALARYPETIRRAADAREPHLVAFSLLELARAFHGYYQRNKKTDRVITDDDATTAARLALVAAVRQVMANGLALLGVTAPDRMVDLSALEGDTDADAHADEAP